MVQQEMRSCIYTFVNPNWHADEEGRDKANTASQRTL